MDPSPPGILMDGGRARRGKPQAAPKPPQTCRPPSALGRHYGSGALTSWHRAGDLLLETLSSDSVHDFSSSSSGRMEEFCEMDLPGGGKAKGFSPATAPDPCAPLGPGTHLEMLLFTLNPGGPQSGMRSRGDRARRGGRDPS